MSPSPRPDTDNNPWDAASFFQKWTFSVPNEMLSKGEQQPLQLEDMLAIPPSDKADFLLQTLRRAYASSEQVWVVPRIMVALFKVHAHYWVIMTAYTILESLARIALPLVLIFLLQALEDEDDTQGYTWAAVISGIVLLQTLVHHVLFFYSLRLGWNWKNASTAFIYDGLFRLSSGALQTTMTGRMVNLISNDVGRMEEYTTHALFTWVSLVDVILVLLVLIYVLDYPSALAGVGSTFLFVPPSIQFAHWNALYRGETAAATDQRVRHIGEIIEGIASVKSYAWENPFFQMIGSLRDRETHAIMKSQTVRSANQSLTFCIPAIVSFITFVIYWRLGGELTLPKVFATMSLLQVLRTSVGRLWTRSIELTSETIASCERIQTFLDVAFDDKQDVAKTTSSAQETEETQGVKSVDVHVEMASVYREEEHKHINNDMKISTGPSSSTNDTPLIAIEGANYFYGDDENKPVLRDVRFSVRRGEILMVVGQVGSGKSSLLSAVLGEMNATSGSAPRKLAHEDVRIAYCAQRAWIIAASVKANVTLAGQASTLDFKSPEGIDEELYKRALESSLLQDDLLRWPAGDLTEIGEKGLSISGGQKARVSLARAVYSDADLYVLDDPLSAVDAHVGKALMTKCIQHTLRAHGKGVVLVTHQLQYLKHADKVLVLDKNGLQRYYGDYAGLVQQQDVMELLEFTHSEEEQEEERTSEGGDNHGKNNDSNEKIKDTEDSHNNKLNQEEEEEEDDDALTAAAQDYLMKSTKILDAVAVKETEESAEDAQRRRIVELEDRQTGQLSFQVFVSYFTAGGMLRGLSVLALILASQVLLMITDYWLRWWASSSFGDQSHILYVWIFAILVFFCFLVGFFRALAWFQFSLVAASNLHERCLWAVLHSPLRFFVANPTGRILNRFAKDQNLVDEMLPALMFMFLEGFIYCLSALVLVCISIPWLLIIMPFLLLHFVILRTKYIKSTREIKRVEAITRSPIYSDFSATLDGLVTLRAYKLEKKSSFIFQKEIDENSKAFWSGLMCARWLGFRLDMESALLVILVAFLAVVLRKQVDVGLIGFTLVYSMALSGLFQWIVRLSVEVETLMTSVERIQAYSALPPEPGYATRLDDIVAVREGRQAMAHLGHGSGEFAEWAQNVRGEVELRGLTVKYRTDLDPVLRDISLVMRAGQKIGICGRTGSGKSSTLLALLRLNMITEGDILVDGRSILQMSLEGARSVISIIPQEPHLFSGTVRFNLDPFSVYSDVQIWDALRDAHIKEYVSQDPLGLQMVVEESGKNFSVGQRQLLSLARAILRRSKVVLMDEVTASIDFQTDRLIQETIRSSPALRDATIITVAHRLRTIADSDVIVVVDAGRIAEVDAPRELLQRDESLFKKLAEQSGEFDDICRMANK